jgi:phage terminase Nu1 subunit (DNA packaging protein)
MIGPEPLRPTPDELVTREELARIMRVSVPTIDRLRRKGMPSITWGLRLRRFDASAAMAWAREQEHHGAEES